MPLFMYVVVTKMFTAIYVKTILLYVQNSWSFFVEFIFSCIKFWLLYILMDFLFSFYHVNICIKTLVFMSVVLTILYTRM